MIRSAPKLLQEFSLLLRSNTIIFGILLAFFFAFKQFHLSRWTLFVFFALATIAVAVKRWFSATAAAFVPVSTAII